ncbi:hypothetical protein PPSIR1_03983 [Plesiocystis pacifica SIR-1]|uniref:Monooxygenase n=1 Tax=Plesiocystis pacifica SIR-1 TaxID=391625 RepID=A6G4F5_9BACT|nr:NAD(P)/FAD-dependent oxidoreductase [Plesiocystis pacifica]EDM79267.1 hypothetical protein PPSIR1_03983 [Plesiocystis pacifica SIR-1]
MNEPLDVAVVGAGFCGLATAAALKTYATPSFAVFEAGGGPGHFWTGNYDRIHLHSPWHDLPADGGLGASFPMFKARAEVLRYLGAYAEHHALTPHIWTQTPVTQLSRDGSERHPWRIVSAKGEHLARHLVVATGALRVPWEPELAGRKDFTGVVTHSRAYRNAKPYAGKRAVVVGSGNSAAEIALDLAQGGASSVTLLVKGPRHFMKLGAMTRMIQFAKLFGMAGPKQVRRAHPITWGSDAYWDKLRAFDKMTRLFSQDLRAFGIHPPERGPSEEGMVAGRIGVMDVGAIAAIRSGAIEVRRGHVAGFTADGVGLDSGGELPADLAVLATGFRHGLGAFLPEVDALLEPRLEWPEPMPATDHRCRSTIHSDLWFAGWELGLLGGLHWGLWGWEVGEKIATELGTFRASMRPPDIGAEPWR